MIDYWPTVFRTVLKPGDRTAVSTAFEARNEAMHAGGPLDPERALRHLLGIKELAAAIGAKDAAKAVGTLLTQQMGDATAATPVAAAPALTPPAAPPVAEAAMPTKVTPAVPTRPQLTIKPAPAATLALDTAPRAG